MLKCPEYEVFEKMCKDNKKKGNGTGPSLYSYDMQRNMPDDAIRKLYDLYVMLWESKHIPFFLKMRWLVLVPKVPNSSLLTDMRPLTLVEVGRKLWMGYFIKQLTKKIHEHRLLRDSQNGGLKERGTDSASILLINALESARELMVQILVSSWDKKRAFDSMSKNLAKFSLIRLGVPREIADYIVDHDLEGPAIIRGGYTKKILAQMKQRAAVEGRSYSKLSGRVAAMLQYLHTERGCGQGDVPSTIVWAATFDILLVGICEV